MHSAVALFHVVSAFGMAALPAHCPTADHVEVHPIPAALVDRPTAPNTVVGRELVMQWHTPLALHLRQRLTHYPRSVPAHMRHKVRPTKFYRRVGGFMVTSAMADVCGGFQPAVDDRVDGAPLPDGTAYTNPRGLFPFQSTVVSAVSHALRQLHGGMVVAPCGVGKSEMIGSAVADTGVCTLVVVPRTDIASQLHALLCRRLPMLRIRLLQGRGAERTPSTCTTTPSATEPPTADNFDVLVAVINSASTAPKELFARVGLMVVDEAHHAPAKMMQAVLANTKARHVLGLTATPYRSDGFEVVLPYLFGPVIATVHRPWMPVVVRRVVVDAAFPADAHANRLASLRALVEHTAWTGVLEDGVLQTVLRAKAAGGRVLVLLDGLRFTMEMCARVGGRVTEAQWRRLRKYETKRVKDPRTKKTTETWSPAAKPAFRARPIDPAWAGITSALYVGVTQTKRERDALSQTADVVWCTESKAYEGLDLDNIHIEWLACKAARPQQHVGRCLRLTTMARVPEILFLEEPALKRLRTTCRAQTKYFEHEEGWPIQTVPGSAVTTTLATAGTPPRTPTRAYQRSEKGVREAAIAAKKRARSGMRAGEGSSQPRPHKKARR